MQTRRVKSEVTYKQVLALLGVFLLYALEPIAAKMTSQQEWTTLPFWLGLAAIFGILGLYAILWQQLLKRIQLSVAYMFRGSTLMYVMVLSAIILGEAITIYNCIGAAMIVAGIILYSREA